MMGDFGERLRLFYVFDEILPSTATDTEQVVNTASALARRGHDVTLALPHKPGATVPTAPRLRDYYQVRGGFDVVTVPAQMNDWRPLQKAFHAWQAMRLEEAQAADAVYTRNLATLHAALARGIPIFYEHFRAWPDQYPPLVPWLRWMMLHEKCLGVVLHSRLALQSFQRLGIPPAKLLVAHNGYSPERVEPRLDVASARRLLGLPNHRPLAVYAGRINERKGLESVLKLASACPEVDFALVGSEGHGPIESQAATYKNVRVFPWQPFDRAVPYLYAADVVLIPPSLAPLQQFGTTVLPMKLFLYLAVGRAILAPRAPDTAEILEHDRNAWLVSSEQEEDILLGFRRLIADAGLRQRLADGARADSIGLTWDARAERLEGFLAARLERGIDGAGASPDSWDAALWRGTTAKWVGDRVRRWLRP